MKKTLINKFKKLKKELLEKSFSRMNKSQKEAVFNINGPLIVLAGAGSGKTTAIINRIVNMINFGNAYMTEEIPEKRAASHQFCVLWKQRGGLRIDGIPGHCGGVYSKVPILPLL